MLIKKCLPLALALSCLLVASLASADEDGFGVSPQRELEQCRSRCQEQQPGGQQRQLCQLRCEQRMRERQEREGRGRRDDDELGHDVFDVSPQREFEQCRSRCQQQQHKGQQLQQCEQRCEQRMRERREKEGRGRRDDELGFVDVLDVSPQREFEQCRRRCEQQQQQHKGQQLQHCEQRCEQRMRERQERERRGREADDELSFDVLDVSPQREFEQCRRRCQQQQQQHKGQQLQQCEQRCEQRRRQREEREGRGRRDEDEELNPDVSPQREFEQCRRRCQQQQQQHKGQQLQQCEQRCEQRMRERERQEREGRGRAASDEEEERELYGEERENPYHFTSQRLRTTFRGDEGHIRVLEKLSERSELLKGIKNYRIAVLEAAPNTFVAPHHCDADTVLVFTKGKGTIGIVRQNNKENYNIERSDVIIVRAGSTVHLVNQDSNEHLQLTKLVTPVNVPGQFEEYFPGAGGEIPQSYFKAFSRNILKQSLSATEEQIERLVGGRREGQREGQRQGIIKRASQEQLRALSQHATSPRRKGRDTSGPIRLQDISPLYSNNYGRFSQVNPEDNKHLEDLDVFANWCELKPGSIMVPHFNSRATVLVRVVEGTGRIEMACPHLGRERESRREEQSAGRMEAVSSRLSPGDIFVVPAGHPFAIEASGNQNLRMVGFGVNARNSERIFIAGKENMIKQLEREAKELAFNMPAKEVEQIFNQPKQSYFVPQERASFPLESVLNLAGLA